MKLKGHCYVAKNGEGFTTFPDLAQTVSVGGHDCIVAAPGVTGFIRTQHLKRFEKIWELLLDAMEESYEGVKNEEYRNGLTEALAMLSYGSTDEPSMKSIKAQAEIRYELSAE